MPTYEYACTSCGHHLEVVQSFSDDPLTTCPNCGAPLRKVFGNIGIVLKGSGFYKNDSRTSRSGEGSGGGPSESKPGDGGAAKESAPAKGSPAGKEVAQAGSSDKGGSSGTAGAGSSSGSSGPPGAAAAAT
jgi:putative FmdB family regulatory protein